MNKKWFEHIVDFITGHPLFKWLTNWTKTTTLPGFDGIPIYDISAFIYNEIRRNKLPIRSQSIAFSFMLALFPSIIFLFSLLPYIPIANLDAAILYFVEDLLPENAYSLFAATISDLVNIPRGGVLSLGFILAIWFSSSGVYSMMHTFQKLHPSTFVPRSVVRSRIVAFQILLVLFVLLIASFVLVIFGGKIITYGFNWLDAGRFAYTGVTMLRWLVILMLFYSAISIIYRLGPSTKRKFPFFSVGATVATLLCILTSVGFSFFVNEFGRYNQIYGSLGTLIVVMVWLNLNSLILLMGFELNAAIAVKRDLKEWEEEKVEDEV